MKTLFQFFVSVCFIILFFLGSCSVQKEEHFISDAQYRENLEKDFLKVRELFGADADSLLAVFNSGISLTESEALKFLYAYMPLSDLADYDAEFFLKNVRLSLAARDSFFWGFDAPEDVFRQFVLPCRVNNENLDTSRQVFFKELLPRIKELDIEQAALEVNHWCHEKVNYQPTDSRTISPLGAIKTAYGRCGEESTFTVAALRSVGIPARQVYTPRWAHVDDNHAWVEVFIHGKWRFMGACEPEAELDIAWFSAPVLRSMMVHTKAFGKYSGTESLIRNEDKYAVLNSLANYAPVKEIFVKVVDSVGNPVNNAYVEFGLYNYAEFYPIKTQETGKDGMAQITTGLGDLRIFTSDKVSKFQIQKITVELTDTLVIVLDRNLGDPFILEFENVPPVAKQALSQSSARSEENKKRLALEDSLRENYIASFYTKSESDIFSEKIGLDKKRVWNILEKSRGNYPEMLVFIEKASMSYGSLALDMLESLAVKDLHDISSEVLFDHLTGFRVFMSANYSPEIIKEYILNPRIYLENISPYRNFLSQRFNSLVSESPEKTIAEIIRWMDKNLRSDEVNNYYNIPISPLGVYKMKACDNISKKLFFISLARSLGIPARLEPASLKLQYFNKTWMNISFETDTEPAIPEYASIKLKLDRRYDFEPLYRIHFGIAKFQDGKFQTLEYDWEKPLKDFPENLELEPGYYQITSGNRLQDGSVLVRQEFLTITKADKITLPIVFKTETNPVETISHWENYTSEEDLKFIGWIDPTSEPGKHFLNDLQTLKATFLEQDIKVKIYGQNHAQLNILKEQIPSEFSLVSDSGLVILKDMYSETNIVKSIDLPVFILISSGSEIFYHSSGYNIGTAQQMLKVYNRLKDNKK